MSKLNKQDVAEHFAAERIVPTNEAEVPPQRLYYKLVNGNWQRVMPSPDTIEYVPASARDAVWEKALGAVKLLWTTSKNNAYNNAVNDAVRALEAARDAALSAGKESDV